MTMQIRYIVLGLSIAALAAACTPSREAVSNPLTGVNEFWLEQADSIQLSLETLLKKAERNEPAELLPADFYKARHHFKKIESLTLFYFPDDYTRLNGPALLRTEEYDDKIITPTGFQVLEEKIFSDSVDYAEVQQETKVLQILVRNLQNTIHSNTLADANIFEALRLELLTIMSMGISGFDSPIAFRSIPETKSALQGVDVMVSKYSHLLKDDLFQQQWRDLLLSTYAYLDKPVEFDAFNRAEFIVEYVNPISRLLYQYQLALHIPNNTYLSAINLEKSTFFEEGTFNSDYFAPIYNRRLKPEVAALGKMLFFDPVLSGSNKRACSSCHNPRQAFADGKTKSVAFNFEGDVARNAPTLINAGFQQSQFWDQRVHFIEDQVSNVIANPIEMHSHMDESASRLMQSEAYRGLFRNAFGQDTITKLHIQKALASYVRSLGGLNARFDQYMRGSRQSLTQNEVQGFNLFMGKAKCGTCHFMPLFNGTVPPLYLETESEVLGVPIKSDTARASVDPDLGKRLTYNKALHAHTFKTSTIRNAALTAPYMHNGVYKALEEVIDFYNRGGGAGIGIDLPNQTLSPDRLNLTKEEQQNIISFIHSLTDTTGLTSMPQALPVFKNARLEKRKVGGEY